MVLLGKTNMDEFAMGSSTENSACGVTHNPWDTRRACPAAAAAAARRRSRRAWRRARSARTPAAASASRRAFCGVVGLKPTYGRVSRYGLVAFGSSLDWPGPFARTVEDAARLLGVIAGHDPLDATSMDSRRAGLPRRR